MRAQSITASYADPLWWRFAPKNVPERLRHRYAGRGQLTVLSAVLVFDLTWEKHHEETFVYRLFFGGRGSSGGFSRRRGGHTIYRQRIGSAGQFGPVCVGFRHRNLQHRLSHKGPRTHRHRLYRRAGTVPSHLVADDG